MRSSQLIVGSFSLLVRVSFGRPLGIRLPNGLAPRSPRPTTSVSLPKFRSTRTRTNTIPDGTKANAAGLSGCACVTRMRSGEKGEVWGKRGSARRLSGKAWVVKPVRACLWRNAFSLCGAPPQGLCKAPHDSGVCWKQFMMLLEEVLVCGGVSFHPPCTSMKACLAIARSD